MTISISWSGYAYYDDTSQIRDVHILRCMSNTYL